MKLMDTSSIILFLDHIPEYTFIIKFSENNEIMIITSIVEEEYYKKTVSSINNPNYNLNQLLDDEILLKDDCSINPMIKNRYFYLGKGEKSIMSLALKYKEQGSEYYCVLDDKQARHIARNLGLNVTGSIGLLLTLKEKGLIENPIEVADKIRQSNFRISDKILEGLYA